MPRPAGQAPACAAGQLGKQRCARLAPGLLPRLPCDLPCEFTGCCHPGPPRHYMRCRPHPERACSSRHCIKATVQGPAKPWRARALGAASSGCRCSRQLTLGRPVRLGRGGRLVGTCPSVHTGASQTLLASQGGAAHCCPLLRAGAGACGHGGRGGKPDAGHAGVLRSGRARAGRGRRPAGGRRGAALGRRGRRRGAARRQARGLSAGSWKGLLPGHWRCPGLEGCLRARTCPGSQCRPSYSLANMPSMRPIAWRSAGESG